MLLIGKWYNNCNVLLNVNITAKQLPHMHSKFHTSKYFRITNNVPRLVIITSCKLSMKTR